MRKSDKVIQDSKKTICVSSDHPKAHDVVKFEKDQPKL